MAILTENRTDAPAAPASTQHDARATASAGSRLQVHAVIGGTMLVFLVPALLDVLSDRTRPYGYLAADAFYYFTIGANWVEHGTPSFDQTHPTNGFHPLWQWVVTLLYAAVDGLGFPRLALVPVAVVACLLAISGAVVLLGLTQVKKGRVSPLFFLLPVGAWPLLIAPLWWASRDEVSPYLLPPLFGTLWNFANGLESALLLLLFALAAWLYVKRPACTVPRALVFGVTLGALSLARLDHAVFALAFTALPLGHALVRRERGRVLLGAWALLAWLAVMGIYLVYNRAVVGRFMPISGAVKSTFPELTSGSVDWLLSLPAQQPRNIMFAMGRIGSIFFPAFVALLYFPFALRLRVTPGRISPGLREGHGRFSEVMLLTAIGTLALAAYDLSFVLVWHIGEWYTPVSVLFVSLFALQVAERLAAAWRLSAGNVLALGLSLGLCAVQLTYFWELHRVPHWGKAYVDFCLVQAPRVVAHYAGSPPSLLSWDDGVVGFATGFPTTSGSRLALDAEAADASASGSFEQLLERRGVDRVTSIYYRHAAGFRVRERSARVQSFAEGVLQAPPRRQFEVEYVDQNFGILRAVTSGQAE